MDMRKAEEDHVLQPHVPPPPLLKNIKKLEKMYCDLFSAYCFAMELFD